MRSLRNRGALVLRGASSQAVRRPAKVEPQPSQYGSLVLMGHAVVVALLVMAAFYFVVFPASPEALLTPFSVLLLALFVWMAWSWKVVQGSLFNLYGLFMLAAMPFHGGFSFLRIFGQAEEQIGLLGDFTPRALYGTMALVIFGFAFMHLGALAANVASRRREVKPVATSGFESWNAYMIGWLMLAVSAGPVLLDFKEAILIVLSGGYKGLFEQAAIDGDAGNTLMGLLASFFLPGVMFLLAGSRDRWIGQAVAAGAILCYAMSYLFLGHRAYAIIPLIVFAWLWHRCIRPLPMFAFATAGISMFLFVAPIIRHVRNLSGADRFSPTVLIDAYTSVENPVLGLIGELGGSMLTITYTMEAVPSMRPFEWGMDYLRAFLNAIPIIDLPEVYGASGTWLAWTFKPFWAANGFGFGYSFIAEAFLNFGWLGAPLFLAFFGFTVVKLLQWVDGSGDPARLAFLASFMPAFLFTVRGEWVDFTRPMLWYALVPFVTVIVLREVQRRLRKRVPTRQRQEPGIAPISM